MLDSVPAEAVQFIHNGYKTVSKYLAEKYGIKGGIDAGAQKDAGKE